MKRQTAARASRLAPVFILGMAALTAVLSAQGFETRHEIREGSREVHHERREARREIATADNPIERRHEIREGTREVAGERYEARREIRRSTW